jgi:hypothetical protein
MRNQFSPARLAAHSLPLLAAALMLALLAGCGAARPAPLAPPVPQSHSVAEAERKLGLVVRERTQAEAAFAASEQLCYAKFFVNNCLDVAREKRRAALSGLRAIEIEAEHFKRQATVEERDRALANAEQQFQAQQASMAAAPAPVRRAVSAPTAPKTAPAPNQRELEHAAKLKRLEAQDQASAAKRAAKAAAFEKRQREAEQRQREIANKKKAEVGEGETR